MKSDIARPDPSNFRNDENLMVIDNPELIEIFQNQFVNLWTNNFSLDRTRQLYKIAKIDFLPILPTSAQTGPKIININTASQDEFTSILQITEPLAQKIITLRDSLSGGFKDLQDLTQLPEITNLEWKGWKEERIIIIVK